MAIHSKYFWMYLLLALAVCVGQILGSTVLILGILVIYMLLLGWSCTQEFTLPALLFFLPWSQILKTGPGAFSFYTFGMVLVCVISLVKRRFWLRRYHMAAGIGLLALTLFAKLLDGSFLAFDYIAFIMLLFLFPVVKEEWVKEEYDFFEVVFFFSAGVIAAALCAKTLSVYPNIARYINIHSYLNIVRLSGFYGDPNFYTAQITAALSGCLVAVLRESSRRRVTVAAILAVVLIYCGFLSGSKSFALIAAMIVMLWCVEIGRMRGKSGRKLLLVIGGITVAVFIATSAFFKGLIEMFITRFSYSKDLSSFTTGRVELWLSYLDEIFNSAKILLLGKGYTNVKVDDRAPHNTVIQAVFQFGIIGIPMLLGWCAGFFRETNPGYKTETKWKLSALILATGAFVPWLALDILFFDEFFLLQWFVFAGVRQLRCGYSSESKEIEDSMPRHRKRAKTRIVWR